MNNWNYIIKIKYFLNKLKKNNSFLFFKQESYNWLKSFGGYR